MFRNLNDQIPRDDHILSKLHWAGVSASRSQIRFPDDRILSKLHPAGLSTTRWSQWDLIPRDDQIPRNDQIPRRSDSEETRPSWSISREVWDLIPRGDQIPRNDQIPRGDQILSKLDPAARSKMIGWGRPRETLPCNKAALWLTHDRYPTRDVDHDEHYES